ncbi:MAG TPA: hypothetical protein VJB05_01520 [archaeon]|nr:hypothetical protein [archaeon]
MHFNRKNVKELFLDAILFSLGIIATSFLYENNLLLTVALIILWCFGIYFWHKKRDIILFVSGAIFGPLAETVAVYFGVWSYANPTFLGIPIWLPLVWGMAIVMIVRFAELFIKIEKK